ncbi:MAG TPA: molybdopterin-synthase adenylyltransferase MoeB [Piscirickettsiaceae bacterium]|nr:molybdopterin-synthase adenylyltransferase MoeB [Piscirickettsiaceae bacterium]HIQ40541.1 molybdopterin-synthase adenylyltransferase MoeB [Sulfurivirga caldicuralii]
MAPLTPQQFKRYSRQIMLMEFGLEKQQQLADSHALIFGLGGLGSPVSIYLAAAGVGTLTLVDFDTVDESNLQRQIVHREESVGQKKVVSAKAELQRLNRWTRVHTVDHAPDETELAELVHQADVVVDCTDNFPARFAINAACARSQTPLVSAAAIRWEGQLSVFDFRDPGCACYQCLYKEASMAGMTCAESGIMSPVVGMMGSMQALETVKLLSGLPTLTNKLLLVDGLTLSFRTLNLPKDPACPVCASHSPA